MRDIHRAWQWPVAFFVAAALASGCTSVRRTVKVNKLSAGGKRIAVVAPAPKSAYKEGWFSTTYYSDAHGLDKLLKDLNGLSKSNGYGYSWVKFVGSPKEARQGVDAVLVLDSFKYVEVVGQDSSGGGVYMASSSGQGMSANSSVALSAKSFSGKATRGKTKITFEMKGELQDAKDGAVLTKFGYALKAPGNEDDSLWCFRGHCWSALKWAIYRDLGVVK